MNIQVIIYVYMAVCISMIIFNCVCLGVFKTRKHSHKRKSEEFKKIIFKNIKKCRTAQLLQHISFIEKNLGTTENLMAFEEAINTCKESYPQEVEKYLRDISPVWQSLSIKYLQGDRMVSTYFAYFISKYCPWCAEQNAISKLLFQLLEENNTYCRENTLQAFYSSGNIKNVVRALKTIDMSKKYHSGRLLQEGLLNFAGNKEELIFALISEFENFSQDTKIVILNYMRLGNIRYDRVVLSLLLDVNQDDEIHFACIRYFGTYKCQEVLPTLLDFVTNDNGLRWEYAAVSASALAIYKCKDAKYALKKALCQSNWYIRFNASQSLGKYGIKYSQMADILNGKDRYAREMLLYHMEQQKLTERIGR